MKDLFYYKSIVKKFSNTKIKNVPVIGLTKEIYYKYFKKIKSYYVGPDAARLLDEGCRLCPTEKSTPEYDLSR